MVDIYITYRPLECSVRAVQIIGALLTKEEKYNVFYSAECQNYPGPQSSSEGLGRREE